MARLPRLTLPGYPHHVIQRGNNRQTIFISDADCEFLLGLMEESSRKFGVAIHGYVLMSNHFHVLATPEGETSLPQMMQAVGRTYVRYFNRRQARTGTLWEGRYRSTLIQAERYLLACMVYIDLNPVRAKIVLDPAAYRWSSYAAHAGLRSDRLLTPHALYWDLGNTPFSREAAYKELVDAGLSQDTQQDLTESALKGWALGSAQHAKYLQTQTSRRVLIGKAGRPRKPPP